MTMGIAHASVGILHAHVVQQNSAGSEGSLHVGAPRQHAHGHPNSALIKGVVCGVRVEDIDDPLMQKIRQLDKLIDELAKGKAMKKILRL